MGVRLELEVDVAAVGQKRSGDEQEATAATSSSGSASAAPPAAAATAGGSNTGEDTAEKKLRTEGEFGSGDATSTEEKTSPPVAAP